MNTQPMTQQLPSEPLVSPGRPRQRRDHRRLAVLLVVAAVAILGYVVQLLPGRGVEAQAPSPQRSSGGEGFLGLKGLTAEDHPRPPVEERPGQQTESREAENSPAKDALKQAAALIKGGRHDDAIAALNRNQPLLKDRPEALVQLGDALLGKRDYGTARDFFLSAIDRNPGLADAYFGYAQAAEGLGDLESAMGGMRIFLHLQTNPDPYRLKVAQARSALWEWEAKLGRGPWGPTKGIPPGFTAEELKRDGKGVGVKMPLESTLQPDGTMKYEIKHADKIKIFNK